MSSSKSTGRLGALEAKMAQQQSTNTDQQKAIQALNATLKEQGAHIQKVSARCREQIGASTGRQQSVDLTSQPRITRMTRIDKRNA